MSSLKRKVREAIAAGTSAEETNADIATRVMNLLYEEGIINA